ncbi:MAG: non-canonical purine NTP pyrophosphatase [Candidatus Micrarchaeota archaeon]
MLSQWRRSFPWRCSSTSKRSPRHNSVVFASSNPEKLREVHDILSKHGVNAVPIRLDLNEPDLLDQRAIAQAKAQTAFLKLRRPAIAEDTAVYFNATPGYPGVRASREFTRLGFDGLLAKVKGNGRGARFVTMVAYCDSPDSKPMVFAGVLHGRIAQIPKSTGNRGMKFPYERIFRPCGQQKMLCEMSAAHKARISHRSKALARFAKWFKSRQ